MQGEVPAFDVAEFLQALLEGSDIRLATRLVCISQHSHDDGFSRLLSEGAERCEERAPAERNEKFTAANHSITLSARTRIDRGILIPCALPGSTGSAERLRVRVSVPLQSASPGASG